MKSVNILYSTLYCWQAIQAVLPHSQPLAMHIACKPRWKYLVTPVTACSLSCLLLFTLVLIGVNWAEFVMVNHIFTHTLGTRDNRACTHQWLQAQPCCVYLQCVTLTLPHHTQSTIKGTCTACFEQSLVSSSKTAQLCGLIRSMACCNHSEHTFSWFDHQRSGLVTSPSKTCRSYSYGLKAGGL